MDAYLLTEEGFVKLDGPELCNSRVIRSFRGNIENVDKNGNSPLHIVINRKLWRRAQELVNIGCNLTLQNKGGETALHIAAHKGVLLGDFYSTDVPVIKDIPFTEAIAKDMVLLCKLILRKDAEDYSKYFYYSKIINMKNIREKTALHVAAESYKNSDIDFIKDQIKNNNERESYIATQKGYKNICKLLLANGASVNIRDGDGNTPIHIAAQALNTELLQILLDSGANVHIRNKYEETPLHVTASCNKDAKHKCKLLIRAGANVTVKDSYNRTPLHFAALNGNYSVCKLLIENGAVVDAIDNYGNVPLHVVVKSKDLETLKYLLDKGANIEHKDRSGKTALRLAQGNFMEHELMCRLLLDRGADVTAIDNTYRTPLHLAAKCSSLPNVSMLLDAGADVNAQDRDGQAPKDLLGDRVDLLRRTKYHKHDLTVITKL